MSDENKEDASDETKQKIVKAIQEGRVKGSEAGQRYFARAGVISSTPDFTIVEAEVHFWGPFRKELSDGSIRSNKGGMSIDWQTESAGFGSLTIYLDDDGKLKSDTEAMGPEFCKSVMAFLIAKMEKVN